MRISIEKKVLLEALSFARTIADRKSTLPILAHVLLRTEGDRKLHVAATDLGITLTSELACKVEEEGALTINAKDLHDMVKTLPGESLSIERSDNNFADIRAGKVRAKLAALLAVNFPKLPDISKTIFSEVDASTLSTMIGKVFACICTDETRYQLNGALFESDGTVARMVATDGYRLEKIERAIAGLILPAGLIVPRKGLIEVHRFVGAADGKIGLAVENGQIIFRRGAAALTVRRLDAQFPPFEQVIPKTFTRVVSVSRVALIEAIQRAALVGVGLTLNLDEDTLTVEAEDSVKGEVSDEIAVAYDGKRFRIGSMCRYLSEALQTFEGADVWLKLSDELDPIVIESDADKGQLAIVMPMRTN